MFARNSLLARLAISARSLALTSSDPNEEMFVVERDGEPVGCFQLSYIPGLMRRGMWRGMVEMVHVAADRRNLGIGAEMMRCSVNDMR